MASHGISEGVENLCLNEDQANSLGAVPKDVVTEAKQNRKKNRKDRRRGQVEGSDDSKPPVRSRVEQLRASRQQQSVNSHKLTGVSGTFPLLNLNTAVKNLPDSFFSDDLPDEIHVEEEVEKEKGEGKDFKKKRRRRQKRKQVTVEEEEEDKTVRSVVQENLNDLLVDDDPGEEIVTNFGDEKCVVSDSSSQFGQTNSLLSSTTGGTSPGTATSRSVSWWRV